MNNSIIEYIIIPPYTENGKTIYPFIVYFNGKELINEKCESIEEYEETKSQFRLLMNMFAEGVKTQFNKNIC